MKLWVSEFRVLMRYHSEKEWKWSKPIKNYITSPASKLYRMLQHLVKAEREVAFFLVQTHPLMGLLLLHHSYTAKKNLFTSYKLNDFLDGPCTCGACIVIPAVVVSNTCSYWPANLDTSVDVPEEKKLYSYSPVHSCTKIINYGITLLW